MPDAVGQALGESGRLFFAMHRDQFTKRGAKRGLGEEVDVDAVEQSLGEGLADIGKGGAARVGGRELVERVGKRGKHIAKHFMAKPCFGRS